MKKPFIYCLALLFWGVLGIQSITAQCNPNCVQATNLNFSTGWDETTGALINAGQVDPHWRLMNIPPVTGTLPGSVATPSAYAINPFQANWNVISGSRPISMASQANFGPNNANPNQAWRFRRYFCVCEDTEVELIGQMRADDTGSLTLYDSNGNPMPFSATLPPAPNANNFNTGIPFSQALFLPAGNYYFEFSLFNTDAVASGFAVQGTMLSANSLSLYDEQMGCCAVSVITGQKIVDNDCNFIYDPAIDQVGVGFVFDLIDNSTGNIIATTQSDAFGEFEFNNLVPGSYTVHERSAWGWQSGPQNIQVTLGPLDVQTVFVINCVYTPNTWAACVHGDISPNPANTYQERGMALVPIGGDEMATLSTTNITDGTTSNQRIVRSTFDATGNIATPQRLNTFFEPGNHSIQNIHVVNENNFCSGGPQVIVGTTNDAGNQDVFLSEMDANGNLIGYFDATATPNENEVVNDFIRTFSPTNYLVWVGTKTSNASPSSGKVIVYRYLNCDINAQREYTFSSNGVAANATGNSIIEILSSLPSYPTAKYALTGAVDNEVYLLLLDDNLEKVLDIRYDVDSNPLTWETGIKLRREDDNIYIVGNVDILDNPIQNRPKRIFMLKIDFSGPAFPVVAENHLYNISGGGEQIVDMEIAGSEELIITGVSELSEAPFTTSFPAKTEKTFIMSIDKFGNPLWVNQINQLDGSRPKDMAFSNFTEIVVVGECWTNELVPMPFPLTGYTQKYDQMVVRTDAFGRLASNSSCENELTVTRSTSTGIVNDLSTTFIDIPESTEQYDVTAVDYYPRPEYCFQGPIDNEPICDSLQIISTVLPDVNGMCCYELDYYNNSPGPVYELCLRMFGSETFANIVIDPALTYTINAAGDEIKIRNANGPALPFGQIQDAIQYCVAGASGFFAVNYFWKDINGNIVCEDLEELECAPDCEADFTWTADCCTVQLDATASGTGPFIYEWDINCDNPAVPDLTGQSVNWTFNGSGTYDVCLKVTDTATGCMTTVQKQVTVVDNPPTLTCPPDITVPTNLGLCTATFELDDPMATDDCTTMFFFSCSMAGATTGQVSSPVTLNKGITTINCFVEDSKGQFADCSYTITVEDQENPVITCMAPSAVSVPACDGGANVAFANPMVTDNCPMVTWTSSHQSGDFFPCGTTMVTFTATDMAGNQSTCTIPVVVNCECAEVSEEFIECTDVDDQFAFSVYIDDLTGSGTNGCTITVSSPQAGINLSGITIIGNGPGYQLSGLIDVAAPPMPNVISIVVHVNCVCPDGTPHSCSFPINLPTPCCKEISIDPQEVCKTGGTVQIPLLGCNTLYDVQQVRWYIADAPCPPTSWTLIQVTNGCADLNLSPIYHNGDVCVYAEVDMGPGAGPCAMLTSNIATITLCEPISCNLSSSQAYCWTGAAITPTPLTVSLSTTECLDSIRWFDPQDNLIPAANDQFSYQPPALSFTLANTECSQSYIYRVEVSNECGTQSCSATIRLDNENAPVGTLTLLAPDVNPLCYGEDVILEYEPECAGDPERWDWFLRLDAVPIYTPLTTNGDRNPLYYSNRLYADTWVKVEKTNGVCPTDEIEIFLDVIDPISINTFTAQYDDVCTPTVVDLSVDFNPNPADPGCSYTVTWFRNGQVIQTTSGLTTAPASYTYTGTPLFGNYYCVVENSCCPGAVKSQVVTLDKPMEVFVAGPCFRCNCDTITLNGIVLNPLSGFNCSYQWYDGGVAIPGETGIDLIVDFTWNGPFTFEVTCTDGTTTCVKDATYTLSQCGDRDLCVVPPQCCESEMAFNDAVDDFMIDVNGATATISNTSLLDCDELSIDWGDGMVNEINASQLPMEHQYASSIQDTIIIDVMEVDDDGTECFSDQFMEIITGTTGVQQPNGLKIFPNPTEGIIQVELPEGDHLPILEVFNLQGKLMLKKDFPSAGARYELDIRSLPAGVYILRSFSQEGKILIEEVIKQ